MNRCKPLHIVLLGLMGAGKSTIGQLLAERLDRSVSDSDVIIAREQGETVRELAVRLGTERMHRLEADHLLSALRAEMPSIICAAASVIDDERCLAALRAPDVTAVWLRADPQLLARRFRSGRHRPTLGTDLERVLSDQADGRSPRFGAAARLTVDVNSRTPSEVVDEIVHSL